MLRVEDVGRIRWVHFARPEKLNAFTVAGYRDLRVELERAAEDPDVHVVVLTGEGRAFSVGADRSLLDGTSDELASDLDAGEEFERLVLVLAAYPKPLVAGVNGLAVGFGCTILLHCDLVIAARSAKLRLPFTAMGIGPEAGSSALLPARMRWDDAMWAVLSSDWLGADQAQRSGLVWRVVADDGLLVEVAAVADALAERDPTAVAATKALLVEGRAGLVRAAHQRELDVMARLLGG